MANRTSEASAGEDLGLKLLKSVREMKAGQAARVTKVELNAGILRWCERPLAERAVEQVVRPGHAAALRRQPCW